MMGGQTASTERQHRSASSSTCPAAEARGKGRCARRRARCMRLHRYRISLRNETVDNLAYGRQKVVRAGRAADEPAQAHPPRRAGRGPEPLGARANSSDMLQKTSMRRGIDLFLIEHNMDVVMNLSQRHHRGQLRRQDRRGHAEGDPEQRPEVIKAYLGDRYKAVGRMHTMLPES